MTIYDNCFGDLNKVCPRPRICIVRKECIKECEDRVKLSVSLLLRDDKTDKKYKDCSCCGEQYEEYLDKCPFCGSKEGECSINVHRNTIGETEYFQYDIKVKKRVV